MSADEQNKSALIPVGEMKAKFADILQSRGFDNDDVEILANTFTENSLDGVYTHGVNRFPRFIEYVDEGLITLHGKLKRKSQAGAIEQWDGDLRAGILNGLDCTERAIELAKTNGMGCVALSNTNHWMRGGTYGWKAAKAGFLFIGWTNTIANMPAWGAADNKLGNNPLVFALPYQDEAIVLDMAMSQYSYGTLEKARLSNSNLPVPGGFDSNNNLTTDPAAILDGGRVLPAGYWKGSGLSLLLDLFAIILTGGISTSEISKREKEYGMSQVFIAIDIRQLPNHPLIKSAVSQVIDDYKTSLPVNDGGQVVYPGERIAKTREENLKKGIPVNKEIWNKINTI